MNDVKLQEGHPVDENLRPLKVGGKSSSLELADTDNGARVRGDLEVPGETYTSVDKMYSGLVPAYSGMIIGYTRIQNDGTGSLDNLIAINTSAMTVLQTEDGTDLSIQFIVPPSGNVEIQCSFWMLATSDGTKFSLSTGTSYAELGIAHTYDADHTVFADETDHNISTICFSVTGLTPDTDTTYYLAGLSSGAGVAINHGKFRLTGNHYPPIILRAIALPATIVTGE